MITVVRLLDLPPRQGFERHPDAKPRSLHEQAVDSGYCRASLIGLSSRLHAAILAFLGIRFNIDELPAGCWMTSHASCVLEQESELDNSTSSATLAAVVG
jgi:hypothetical protein